MSVLQVSNIHFESSGNNRLQYTGSNGYILVAGGSNVAVINTTAISYPLDVEYVDVTVSGNLAVTGNTTLTGAATLSNTVSVTGNATFSNTVAVTGNFTIDGTTTANVVTVNGATTLSKEVVVGEYNITGTANTLDPSNGIIQRQTLSANVTYTDGLANGESIIIMINDGGSNQVTWPTIKWVNNGNSAPTLPDGDTWSVVSIWKTAGSLYGAVVGND